MTTHRNRRTNQAVAVLAAVALLLGSCGSNGESSSDSSEPTSTTTTTIPSTTDTTAATSSTDTSSVTTTVPDTTSTTTTTTADSTTTTLAGEPFDGFIKNGDELGVVGVWAGDGLNVRAAPGTDADIITVLKPTATGVVATGAEWKLPRSIWYEVRVAGTTGWVSSRYVAFVGGVDDHTSAYIAEFGWPEAPTMNELGQIIADNMASVDPPSRITRSVSASVGDLGEVTYDVIGIGDDATIGYRLHIFAASEDGGETFGLKSIERTTFCGRGIDGEYCI